MSRRTGSILFLLLAAAFFAANRGAYRGYFQDDEFDTLSWTRRSPVEEYFTAALTPRFLTNNFRPVGHFYFREAERLFGMDFPGYVAAIQALHLLNVWLVWLLARRLGARPWPAAAACLFFGFHMALFDAVWKPMYVFDVLCATFCLLSILLYAQRQWVLSFVAFWLAYKSKELAVMLPLVLACYEIWFGQRRWKPLIPFFAVSLSFGIQGLLLNPNKDNDYTFRFTLPALATTVRFYAGRVFLVPYLGLLLPLAAWRAPNRRTFFGLAALGLFLLPLLFLPGRLLSAYCYLPFTGLAIAFAGVCETIRPVWAALFLLLWLPRDIEVLRLEKRETLARDNQVRAWVTSVETFAKYGQPVEAFIFSGAPEGFHRWGVEGALSYVLDSGDLRIYADGEAAASEVLTSCRVALLEWDGAALSIIEHAPGQDSAGK
jgi:hypothetical protein